jgi:hypothetical protein
MMLCKQQPTTDFFLDFTFQWLYKRRMQQTIVARFHENGRENRNHGNQEKGKKEKEVSASRQKPTGEATSLPQSFLPSTSGAECALVVIH